MTIRKRDLLDAIDATARKMAERIETLERELAEARSQRDDALEKLTVVEQQFRAIEVDRERRDVFDVMVALERALAVGANR